MIPRLTILIVLMSVLVACGTPERTNPSGQAPYPPSPALQPEANPSSDVLLENAYPTPPPPDATATSGPANPLPSTIAACTISAPTTPPTATIPPTTYALGPKQVIPTTGWSFAPAWIDADTVLAVTQPITESDLVVAALDLQGTIVHIYGPYNYRSDVLWINQQPVWVTRSPESPDRLTLRVGTQVVTDDLFHGHISHGFNDTVLYTAQQPPQAHMARVGFETLSAESPLPLPIVAESDIQYEYQYALKTAWSTDGRHGIYYSMDGIVVDNQGSMCAIPLDADKPYIISAEFAPNDPNLIGMIIGKEMDDRHGPYEKEFVTLNLLTGVIHHYTSMVTINSADFEWLGDGENVMLNWRYEEGSPNSLGILNIYSNEFIKFEEGFDIDASATSSFKSLALSSNKQYVVYIENTTPSDSQLIYRSIIK